MVHLEIEPEEPSEDDIDPNAGPGYYQTPQEETFDSQEDKLEVTKVRGLHKIWLSIQPDKQDLSALLNETFQLGFDSLKVFERWSMHADLKPYDSVLEPWDYRSYERWEPPGEQNELYLNCDEGLQENP